MLGRILTAIFYAAVFFALGAWSGGSLKPVGNALWRGGETVVAGAEAAWDWAFGPAAHDGEVTIAKPKPDEPAGTPEAAPQTAAALETPAPEAQDDDATLTEARRAFARGNIQAAIEGYRSYLASHDGDADGYGELGNVYFQAGENAEAARAFHTAALFLLADGDTARAAALLPVIRQNAPGLAADLDARLAAGAAAQQITGATVSN